MSRRAQQLAAIAAIADERYAAAQTILDELRAAQPRHPHPGICRFCGCSEARGCAIVVVSELTMEPTVVRCGWADDECTICTNAACLERWRRDAPAELDVDLHDIVATAAPRILLP